MVITDPIADMISAIKTAILRRKEIIDLPASKLKEAIAAKLLEEGFISDQKVLVKGNKKYLRIRLKYGLDQYEKPKYCAIREIKKVSRPGCRIYKKANEIYKLTSGYGTSILSTSRGIMTDEQARKEKIGGEVLINVW